MRVVNDREPRHLGSAFATSPVIEAAKEKVPKRRPQSTAKILVQSAILAAASSTAIVAVAFALMGNLIGAKRGPAYVPMEPLTESSALPSGPLYLATRLPETGEDGSIKTLLTTVSFQRRPEGGVAAHIATDTGDGTDPMTEEFTIFTTDDPAAIALVGADGVSEALIFYPDGSDGWALGEAGERKAELAERPEDAMDAAPLLDPFVEVGSKDRWT